MPQQVYRWTCSICAADFLLRATGLDPYSTREKVAVQLGYPTCVDEYSGLKDTQCLVRLFGNYDVAAHQEWVSWSRAIELASTTTYILNSTSWYHFVSLRGLTDWGGLWIGNSAMGYKGITDTINQGQWNQWAGSWQVVWLEH